MEILLAEDHPSRRLNITQSKIKMYIWKVLLTEDHPSTCLEGGGDEGWDFLRGPYRKTETARVT